MKKTWHRDGEYVGLYENHGEKSEKSWHTLKSRSIHGEFRTQIHYHTVFIKRFTDKHLFTR